MPRFFKKQSTINNQQSITRGFTLIELLVVIAIISILATLLMTNFIGIRQRGRDAQRKSDLRQIQQALELYRSDNGYYPATIATCGKAVQLVSPSSATTVYMNGIPCDPLTKAVYIYCTASGNAGCSSFATLPSSCSGSSCTTYAIYTCLENISDPEEDAADGQAGDLCGASLVSYTVKTP